MINFFKGVPFISWGSVSKTGNPSLLRPFYYRTPWSAVIFFLVIAFWFSVTYALDSGAVPFLPVEFRPEEKGPRPFLVALWVAWSLITIIAIRKIQDPKAGKLPHAQAMVLAAEKVLSDYESRRRDIILDRYDEAGALGFLGGHERKEFEINRFTILKLNLRGEEKIREIEKFQSTRSASKLRNIYYRIESSIDRVEILARKVDRFLRSKGVDPEELAPSRPLPD
ncbi:hypothetical protein [Nocardiopsis kunsanensis]|uniref:hypothetical protein n=1 Tax=Nocardiopsis kunsanensis TaxID=141693 RepID=UPI001360B50E|nr:hypothetical protein [Nocardiopsis kunsanensis]